MISSSDSKSETGIKHNNQFKDSKHQRYVYDKEENSLFICTFKVTVESNFQEIMVISIPGEFLIINKKVMTSKLVYALEGCGGVAGGAGDFRPLSEDFRRFSKIILKARRTFRTFPRISESFRRCPKISEDCRRLGRPEDVSMIHQRS